MCIRSHISTIISAQSPTSPKITPLPYIHNMLSFLYKLYAYIQMTIRHSMSCPMLPKSSGDLDSVLRWETTSIALQDVGGEPQLLIEGE